MTTGYILIGAILILGGVIATVGDRIGTRVGKARLSLFKLRPRKTAVLVTIVTGGMISASTLAILFAADDQLRTGVFKLEEIQDDLRTKGQELEAQRNQLETTTKQKEQVERDLTAARNEQKAEQAEAQKRQAAAQERLISTNQSLQAAIAKQAETQAQLNRTVSEQAQTEAQLNRTQAEKARAEAEKASSERQLNLTTSQLGQIASQFQQAQKRLGTVTGQAATLRTEIQQLETERQQLIQQRNAVKAAIADRDRAIAKLDQNIDQRDRDIAERDQVIAQRETLLKNLKTEQQQLEQEVLTLEQSYEDLRLGNLALVRGQVLSAGVVRIVEPSSARQAVDQLLREANRTAIQLSQPGIEGVNERVVKITPEQVDQLIAQIDDGRDYVVRIICAGNYVLGEDQPVQVFADAVLNQVVFSEGDVVAVTSANPATMTPAEIQKRVNLLLVNSQFRARNAGLLRDTIQIGDGRLETLNRFFEQLRQYNQQVDIQVVAAEPTYITGPLKIQLLVVQNGQIVFRT